MFSRNLAIFLLLSIAYKKSNNPPMAIKIVIELSPIFINLKKN